MLVLNPRLVRFGSRTWPGVSLVAIERRAARLAIEWSDMGPHPVFADAPEQRLTIRIIQDVAGDEIDAPTPGEQAVLVFYTAPTGADARRRKVSITAVITGVTYDLSLSRGTQRRTSLVAVSADGAADPIAITDPVLGEV